MINQHLLSIKNDILTKNRTTPNAIIIIGTILHAITLTGKEKNQKRAKQIKEKNVIEKDGKIEIDDAQILIEQVLKNKNENEHDSFANVFKSCEIIYMEVEGIRPELYEFDRNRNVWIDKMNEKLRELLPRDSDSTTNGSNALNLQRNLQRMSVNLKTAKSKSRKTGKDIWLMAKDRFHLQSKESPRDTSPTLLANMNIIFNYLCNRFGRDDQDDNLCCNKNSFSL